MLAGCDSHRAADGCLKDQDCAAGARCEPGTGVCVQFRNPLDASVPDGTVMDFGVPADLPGAD